MCTQWAIWRPVVIAVPLCLSHPLPSLQYVLEDTGASMIVVSPALPDSPGLGAGAEAPIYQSCRTANDKDGFFAGDSI